MFDWQDQHMPVAVVSGSRGLEDRAHHLIDVVVMDDDIDLNFYGKREVVLVTQPDDRAMRLRRMVVPFSNVQTVDPDAVERLFDLIQFAGPDQAANQFHTSPSAGRRALDATPVTSRPER